MRECLLPLGLLLGILHTCLWPYRIKIILILHYKARVAEWSKALCSGRSIFGCGGSNPLACIRFLFAFMIIQSPFVRLRLLAALFYASTVHTYVRLL